MCSTWRPNRALWGLMFVAAMTACNVQREPAIKAASHVAREKDQTLMAIDQKLFLNVPLNSNDRNPCSPVQDDPNWRGILIQVPLQVKFRPGETVGEHGSFAAIPICGFYLLSVPAKPVDEPMQLVAVNLASRKTHRGDVIELDPSPSVPPPASTPLSPGDLKGLASGGCFNPNLADFVDIPAEPASYDVHVEFRGFKSNVVTIEIVEDRQ